MNTILIQAETDNELAFIQELLAQDNIQSTVVSDDDVEDAYFLKRMLEADSNDTVPKERILQKLNQ
jgi:hypothetical protein